jgi:uncharacterized membrane protein (DUF106 family)
MMRTIIKMCTLELFSPISTVTMVGYLRCFCSMYVAVLAACMPQTVRAQHDAQSAPRRVDVMVGNSDEYAETVVSLLAPERSLGIGFHDHAKITSILSTTKEMINTAKALIDDERTLKEGTEMMEEANSMFGEVKDHIAKRALEAEAQGRVRRKYSEHDIQQAEEDEGRALDVARSVYEVVSQCTMSIYIILYMLTSLCFVSYCNSR